MRLPRALPALSLLLSLAALAGCQVGSKVGDERVAYERVRVTLPGEDELLRMEEERWSGDGRLKALLAHRSAPVRRRAAIAAGRVGDRALEPDLQKLFADKEAEVRAAAAWAAGQLGDPALATDIESLFADPDPAVRRNALVARSLLGGSTPAALAGLLTLTPPDEAGKASLGAALVAAARFDDAGLSAAIAPLLAHPDPEIRWRAAYALYRHARGGEALAGALADADPRVRAYAALGVGAAGHDGATPALVAMLADASSEAACAAATALGRLRAVSATDALAEMARSQSPRRRQAALQAIASGGLSATLLTELASDPSPHVRALAIDGLRRIKAGGGTVTKAARDPEWRVRAAAARALAESGNVTMLAQTMQYDADARVIPPVLEGLARHDYKGLDTVLLKHLADKDPMVRATAARLLQRRRSAGAVDALVQSWEMSKTDDILDARLAILDALATAGGTERVLNVLKLGASDSNRLVRRRAWALLERLNATEGIEPPGRQASIKTDNYYRDMAGRGDYEFHANIETDKGTLVFSLDARNAPFSARFLDEVATAAFYDDQAITHVDPPFEIGDGDDRGDGHGYYGSWVTDEAHDRPFEKVSLTLSRPLGRDSGTSQFRITLLPRPDLDGIATQLGELLSGAEVLEQLEPGDAIRKLTVTQHEFRGKYEERRIDMPVAQRSPAPGETAAPEEPGAWRRPTAILYMAVVSGVMFLVSLLPLLVSAEKREDFPAALWLVILLLVAVGAIYTWMVWQGDYYTILTSPKPGPRILERPNPPVMDGDQAQLACLGAMAWVMLNMAMLYFLVAGRSFARWLFLFLSLIEIAMFTAQISTKLPFLYVLSQIGIGVNLFKIWLLLMDRQTKEYLAPESS